MVTKNKPLAALWQDSYLGAGNESYLENLYESYLAASEDLSPEWKLFFDQLSSSAPAQADVSHDAIRQQFVHLAQGRVRAVISSGAHTAATRNLHQEKIMTLIDAFRRLGHLYAKINPLSSSVEQKIPALELSYYGFSQEDQQKIFEAGYFPALKKEQASLSEILKVLHKVYCGSIGFEYQHINRTEELEWIRSRIEQDWVNFKLDVTQQKNILKSLVAADGLEKYIGIKYVGQKRFSLEGGDSLIPLLEALVNRCAQNKVKEIVVGMAHRGRLNVLVNIVGKAPRDIFSAFEGGNITENQSGDVKYHLGYSSNVLTESGTVHLALAFNPSHLEIVSPVAQGSVRARQRRQRDKLQDQVLPLQIHGDAAFAGQGVVMETFSMSQTRWFGVGGSIHIVINNQVGFTTSEPKDARSTTYCTDIAKMVEAPILHVNGNDPEAVYFAALFAADYRQKFKRDVVIDLVCYRRHGHNETDEPSATQPLMYQSIKAMPAPYQLYAETLISQKVIEADYVKQLSDAYRQSLEKGDAVVAVELNKAAYPYAVNWEPYLNQSWKQKSATKISMKKLKEIALRLEALPVDFNVQPQVNKMLEARKQMTQGATAINWGYAETLAYASLLEAGYPIRLCGQDAGRGTFAHRHAVLRDQKTNEVYIPLSHISSEQAQINIVDSLLSEEAVLAFEYGYATAEPNYLVIWEAQFGDFANGAQVVIDQFISSGEQKWARLCGLVMLLPHGYEGQGPEHSSARLERYLQLCAQDNMQVVVPSTPAQIFHLLRRQIVRPYRKPLVVMTPKSLLRHPLAVSALEELTQGEFQLIIPEVDNLPAGEVTKVVICCGKVYYDLLQKRRDKKLNHIAIIRIEQLYPFPEEQAKSLLSAYAHVKNFVWCQEEPKNQGAWTAIEPYLRSVLSPEQKLSYAGRAAAASPAVGYHAVHEKEQKALVDQALI